MKEATGGISILYRGQLHGPAALSRILTAQWAGWAPEPASTLKGGKKSPDPFSRWSNLLASHFIY